MNSIGTAFPAPKAKFLRIKCTACGNEQTTFSAASTKVKCNACGAQVSRSTGGKAEFSARILKEHA